MPVDTEGMIASKESLKDLDADWVYVTPACQDPTGAVFSKARRNELLSWSNKHKVAIIEDGWDSDFHYGPTTLPTLFATDKTDSVFYLYTFFRLLYPLTTTTLLVLPPALVDVFHSSKRLSDPPFATAADVVLCELLENGYLEKHIRSVWKQFRKRRQAIIFELTKQLGRTIMVQPFTGGMHAIVRLNGPWSKTQIMECALSSGLPIAPTTSYYTADAPSSEFMIFFAGLDESNVAEIVKQFALALNVQPLA